MDIIIQQFYEKVTSELERHVEKIFIEGDGDITEVINTVKENLDELGCNIIKEFLEECDQKIKKSTERKKNWVVQQKDMKKTLITIFGEVKYLRVYYKSKGDKGFTYLLDDIVGIERYQRMDNGLTSKIIELASDHSYQKSADLAVKGVKISRETVKNKIRKLGKIDNRELEEERKEKKKVKRLYVEADEDHIALQHGAKRTISRLIYVHEGLERVNKTRNKLKNVKYFSGLYKNNVEDLWLEVIDYIDDNYDVVKIETTYLAGDGAKWIKEGLNWLPRPKYVLDRYHLNKYVLKATGHLPKIRFWLWEGLNECDIYKVKKIFKEIIKNTKRETKLKAVKDSRGYILSNWGGIVRYCKDPYALGCSAEGHISHILSHRMSSRPLGWSTIGAEQMSRMRAFKFNGGKAEDIYKLIRQKKKDKKIAIKTEKIFKRSKTKTLYPAAKEVLPALKSGKVNGTYRAIKAYAF
ncbi:MAG: ISLre2 family transposase [Halanaerobiales bacterium]|nr:ISLre2 family transposase [Halanaerobiales bacterium]